MDIQEAKEKLLCYTESEWKYKSALSLKLRTFVTFKENYELEQYITSNLSKQERSALSQLRCGILPIRIETGRFRYEALPERTCVLCEKQEIEDEKHFI